MDEECGGSRPRRLTRQESRAVTRQRLLDAAAAIFAERGFYGASLEDIAERAGFSRGAFYSNFDTKEDLFLALLDDRVDADLEALRALERDGSPHAFLAFLAGRGSRSRQREAQEWALLSAEFWLHVLRHPHLVPKLASRQRAARSALARVIETTCAQMGLALPGRPEELASLVLAVDDGLVVQEALDPTAVPADLRMRALALFVGGMVAGSSAGSAGGEGGI